MNKHNSLLLCGCRVVKFSPTACTICMKQEGLAQMVEVPGSIPGFSKLTIISFCTSSSETQGQLVGSIKCPW